MQKSIFSFVPLLTMLAVFPASASAIVGQKNLSENIEIKTNDGITLHGTLLDAPDAKTVVLIIAGSGPTDRDGNQPMMRGNSLKMLANALSDSGIASLRYDKRGIGESRNAAINEGSLRYQTYVNDVKSWVEELRKLRKYSKIVLIGHSEGALLSLSAIDDGALADGMVSLAGPGRPMDAILKSQLIEQPQQIRDIAYDIIDRLHDGENVERVPVFLSPLFGRQVQNYIISLMKIDPRVLVHAIPYPMLVIQGDNDIQISVQDARNLSSHARNAELVIINGMNHVLKDCAGASRSEQMETYFNPAIPINQQLVTEVVRFIKHTIE